MSLKKYFQCSMKNDSKEMCHNSFLFEWSRKSSRSYLLLEAYLWLKPSKYKTPIVNMNFPIHEQYAITTDLLSIDLLFWLDLHQTSLLCVLISVTPHNNKGFASCDMKRWDYIGILIPILHKTSAVSLLSEMWS